MPTPALTPRRRGRPQKFGRPARLVAMTLPEDVVAWLESIQTDLGRAVVMLYDAAAHRQTAPQTAGLTGAEIVEVGEGRGLILVDPAVVRGLTGVATIPFSGGRAFLALEPAWTIADLELAVVDCLDGGVQDKQRRVALTSFRAQLREWRSDPSVRLKARSIIVVERGRARPRSRGQVG